MGADEDVLQEIPDEDLLLLCDLYKDHRETAPHAYSLLKTCIAWKRKKPDSQYVTLFGVDGDWLKSGTFILLMQFNCHDLFIYTIEKNCQSLRRGLTETNKIDWKRKSLWYSVSGRHRSTVADFLNQLKPPGYDIVECNLYAITREKALEYKFQIPDEVYLDRLDKSHVPLINSVWPHKSETSEKYLLVLLEMNNSYGLFLKSDHSLVCWVLRSPMGQMCNLQTLTEHKRKGYAMLITKAMAKQVAEDGFDPVATIVRGNVASETMFSKLGFCSIDSSTFFVR